MRSRFEEISSRDSRSRLGLWTGLAAASILIIVALVLSRQQIGSPAVGEGDSAALLEKLHASSSFDRLGAITSIGDRPELAPELELALLERIEHDPSVNVRLSAIRALLTRSTSAIESDRLTRALTTQRAAIVQAHFGYQLLRNQRLSEAELRRIFEIEGVSRDVQNILNPLEES